MNPEPASEGSTGTGPTLDDSRPGVLAFKGQFRFADAAKLWDNVRAKVEVVPKGARLAFDMEGVESIDGASMALLVYLRGELTARGVEVQFTGAHEEIDALVHLYKGDVRPVRKKRRKPQGILSQIGAATLHFLSELKSVLAFLGDMVMSALGLLKEPRTGNWKDIIPTMERSGADAVPIVVLITFLVGFVMGYQGSNQLKQFGANIYVADLVGLSITRELGPLMTAIILCGRSGAAFAAELGSMKVSEEIDALRTMGFGPIRYLVLPRTVALMLVLPILTLLGDLMGVVGGLAVGITSLNLTVGGYLSETQKAVHVWDVFSGLVKSVVFALAISLISCQQGFATSGGAEGVGRRTTASVVAILFSLIIIDAGFTMLFHVFHV